MARRRHKTADRSALNGQRDAAAKEINRLKMLSVETHVDLGVPALDLMHAIFPADMLAKSREAFPFVTGGSGYNSYRLVDGIYIKFNDWEDLGHCPMLMDKVEVHGRVAIEFLERVRQAREIHTQWAMVHHVLNWLDANATLGAIRYYWPTALALMPEGGKVAVEMPSHYREPVGIGRMLPMIRETASIVTSALLMPAPAAEDRKKPDMMLALHQFNTVRFGVDFEVGSEYLMI